MTSEQRHPSMDTLLSAEQNRKMFNTISRRYDLLNRLISLGLDRSWRNETASMVGVSAGERYLDIGTGTGDLAFALARQCTDAGIYTVDSSENMIRIAQKKCTSQEGENRIHCVQASALSLPFPAAAFDGVTMGFCVRNVTDRLAALQEIARVLVPGGRCVILELSIPQSRVAFLGYTLYTRLFIPIAAALLSQKQAYDYLNRSIKSFPSPVQFRELMCKAAFTGCTIRTLLLGSVTIFYGEKPR